MMGVAEVDPWTVIFIVIYALFEYVLPALRKNKQSGELTEEPEWQAPEEELELEPQEVEPPPVTAAPLSTDASRDRFKTAFLAARRALSEALAERRRVIKRLRAMAELGPNPDAVERLLLVFESDTPDQHLADMARADADAAASVADQSVIPEMYEAAQTVLTQVSLVHRLMASMGGVVRPTQRLLWTSAEEMTVRLRRQLGGGRRHEQWELIPLTSDTDAELDAWFRRAALIPLLMPAEPDPLASFGALSRLMQSVVLMDRAALESTLDEAWDVLNEAVQSGTPTGKAVEKLLGDPSLPRQLVSAIPLALVSKYTGPMALAVQLAQGLPRNPSPLLAALFDRAGYASVHVDGAVRAAEQSRVAWDYIAATLQDALSESAFSGGTDVSLWHLIPSWGPAEDQSVTRSRDWLSGGGGGRLDGPLSAVAGLVAWAVHQGEQGESLTPPTLERLLRVVQGDAVMATSSVPGDSTYASDLGLKEALVLHAILSPPVAARGGPFKQRRTPIWGRRQGRQAVG